MISLSGLHTITTSDRSKQIFLQLKETYLLHIISLSFRYSEGVLSSVLEIESKGKLLNEGITCFHDISKATTKDHFGMIFTGYIYAPADGLYTFSTYSEDGSMLSIGGRIIAENDGSHSVTRVTGRIPLKKGYHPYELLYFEDYEGQTLSINWIIPGNPREENIEPKYLFLNTLKK